jgi:hypothetical protein
MVWPNTREPLPRETADLFFARSEDGGRSWSLPMPIYLAEPGLSPFDVILEPLPDGSLLAVFTLLKTVNYLVSPLFNHEVVAIRSTDDGKSWSAPVRIAATAAWGFGAGAEDEEGEVQTIPHSQFAVGRDGTAFVVWHDIDTPGSTKIYISASENGGSTWSAPRTVVRAGSLALLPSVAVMPNGTLGVTWYDTRTDKRDDDQLTTEYWFAHSHDKGTSWEERKVAGPFNLRSPRHPRSLLTAVLFPMGEYTGLEAMPDGFVTAFGMADPLAVYPYTDVFFARLRVPPKQ